MYVLIDLYIHTSIKKYVYVHLSIYTPVFFVCVCVFLCCVCVGGYTETYMHVYMYMIICTYMYIHIYQIHAVISHIYTYVYIHCLKVYISVCL